MKITRDNFRSLESKLYAAKAKRATRTLIAFLKCDDQDFRRVAALVLVEIRTPAAIAALRETKHTVLSRSELEDFEQEIANAAH